MDDDRLEDDEMDTVEDKASVGCDPYLCHYLRTSKIVRKVNGIVKKIKIIRAAGEGDVK